MTKFSDQDLAILSDLHKYAKGFRPSPEFWARWKKMTVAEKFAVWDSLVAEVEANIELDRKREAMAIARFEERIKDANLAGCATREEAIRYIANGIDNNADGDYIAYRLGLPMSYADEISMAIKPDAQGWR